MQEMGWGISALETLHEKGSVVSSKAERVAQRPVDSHLARRIRHVVEVTLRVRIFKIDRWRNDIFANCLHTGSQFDATGRSEKVAGHGLG